ncbi:MAG: hypothetical protein AAGJ97_02005, partial [Planctomycetota bacterium]
MSATIDKSSASGILKVAAFGLAGVGMLAGCGGSDLDVVPVSGKVLVDGKPAAFLSLSSRPVRQNNGPIEVGPNSVGQTNENGEFELRVARTSYDRGAVPGPHEVTFANMWDTNDAGNEVMLGDKLPKNATTKIDYVVPDTGKTDLVFELVE